MSSDRSDRGPPCEDLVLGQLVWFWAPAMKGAMGRSSGTPQWCSHLAKHSQYEHSMRESMEAAPPGWANGKPATQQVSSGTSEQQTGRRLGSTEAQALGESFLNLNALMLVSLVLHVLLVY